MKHTCRVRKSQPCQHHELTQPFKFKEAWLAVYYKTTGTHAVMEGVMVSFIIVADRVMSAEQPAWRHLWERYAKLDKHDRFIRHQRDFLSAKWTAFPWNNGAKGGKGGVSSDHGSRGNFRIKKKKKNYGKKKREMKDDSKDSKWKRTFERKCLLDLDTLVTFLRLGESCRDKEGDILLDSEFQGGLKHSRYGW